MKLKCKKCKYEWNTSSNMMFVSCPSCLQKVRNKREMLVQTAADNPNKLPKTPPSKKIIDHPEWFKTQYETEDEAHQNDK